MYFSPHVMQSFRDEFTKIAADIPMSFFTAGSPMAQKAKQVAGTVAKKLPPKPSVMTSAPPMSQLLKR